MIPYELFKQMKDAGFPLYQRKRGADQYAVICRGGGVVLSQAFEIDKAYFYTPTLEEVIEACGERFDSLSVNHFANTWTARENYEMDDDGLIGEGSTPLEAVCMLWLELNKK